MNKALFTRNGKPPSNVDTVVGTIKDLLIKRHLRPGDLIPSENDLSESLSISRGSIREAMKILAAFGVVEIRQGDGTYISTTVNKKLFDPLLFSVLVSDPDLDELAELRTLIERGIVRLIVANASDEDIGRLNSVYEKMAAQTTRDQKDMDELLATDVEFHGVMAEITQNYLVQHVYAFVMDLFAPTMKPGHGLESHRRIVQALFDRDIGAAVAAVEEHDETWQQLNRAERENAPEAPDQ
jgi:GntR family transcriptional regulator, transcriptional repressor for pyruvate dehydrogenase complex